MLLFFFHILLSVASATDPLPSLEKLNEDWSHIFFSSTEVLSAPDPKFNSIKIDVQRSLNGRDYEIRQNPSTIWSPLGVDKILRHFPAASPLHVTTTSLKPVSVEGGPEISGIPAYFFLRPNLTEFDHYLPIRYITNFLVMELTPKEDFRAINPNLRLWVDSKSHKLVKIDILCLERRALIYRLIFGNERGGSKSMTVLDPIFNRMELRMHRVQNLTTDAETTD